VAQPDLKGKGRAAKASRSFQDYLRPANYTAEGAELVTGTELLDLGHRNATAQVFLSEGLL